MTNFNKNKIIMMAAGIVLLGILALYSAPKFHRTDNTEPWKSSLDNNPDESNWFYKTYKSFVSGGANWIIGEMGEKGENEENGTDNIKISQYQNYSNSNYGFSFQYPPGFNIASFEEGEGEVVLIKSQIPNPNFQTNPNDQIPNSKNQEIQIYISSFDEPEGSLTYERLRRDLPDMIIEDPKAVLVGQKSQIPNSKSQNEIPALLFFSKNESLGRTREIWFKFNGNLYQITTYPEMDPILENIIKSWSFN